METQDIFTFYKEDFQSASFAAFDEMRRKGKFCDLTITIQNHSVAAHRIIVAAAIPYFQSESDISGTEGDEKEIGFQDNLDPRTVESLILFAYTGKLDITVENVQSLLVTTEYFQLVEVRDSCIEFLSKRLNIQNVVQVRELATRFNHSHLMCFCNCFIRENFQDFSKTPDFLSLPLSCVKELVSADDLIVLAEEVVFEAIMKWIKFIPSERERTLPELLTEVRMIHLPILYLMEQVDTEELILKYKSCRDLVNKVKYYHLLPDKKSELVNLKTRPRNRSIEHVYAVCSDEVPGGRQLHVFTFQDGKWLDLSSREFFDHVCGVIAANGKIYILLDQALLTFDPRSNEWKRLGSSNSYIMGAALVFHRGKIFCCGSAESRFSDKMCFFDTETNEWSMRKDMKTERMDSAAATLGEFIYVTGGYLQGKRMKTAQKYSPTKDEWTDIAEMLVGRDEHGCTAMGEKIYVCGGEKSGGSTLRVSEVYDPLTNTWSYISPMQKSKFVISLFEHYGRLYAFGESDAEVYEVETDKWKSCSFLPTKCEGAACISASNFHSDPS